MTTIAERGYRNARLVASKIVLDAPNEWKMAYTKTTAKRWRRLNSSYGNR